MGEKTRSKGSNKEKQSEVPGTSLLQANPGHLRTVELLFLHTSLNHNLPPALRQTYISIGKEMSKKQNGIDSGIRSAGQGKKKSR